MSRSRVWYEARIVRPFIAWGLDGATMHYTAYDQQGNLAWFWYNLQTLTVEDGQERLIRNVSIDTLLGRYYVNDRVMPRELDPYVVAHRHAYVLQNTYRLPWVLYDYNSIASAATVDPVIPRGSLVRLTIVVMNDRDVEWTKQPKLHIQLNPPIPSLRAAAEWNVALPRTGLRWEDETVYHWVPGVVTPLGDELLTAPRGIWNDFTHEFETSDDIATLGIALEGGEGGFYVITRAEDTSSRPVPWTDARIMRIEFAPPVEKPRRRVEEYDRDWRARIAARRQVTG
jgi:hypothetical protein